ALFGKKDGNGWAVLKGILKNAVVVDASSLVVQGVSSGEYGLGLTVESGALKYIKAGSPIDIIYPAEGTSLMLDSSAEIRGAAQAKNAKVLLDWLQGKGGQELMARLDARPLRLDAVPAGLPVLSKLKPIQIDHAWAAAERETILQ